jgi:hypothetical protein
MDSRGGLDGVDMGTFLILTRLEFLFRLQSAVWFGIEWPFSAAAAGGILRAWPS